MKLIDHLNQLQVLETELNGVKQGISFYRGKPYTRLREILIDEEQVLELKITELKNMEVQEI